MSNSSLTGLEQVVVAVGELDAAVGRFRDLYRFPRPVRAVVPGIGTVASFPGHPLALATPDGSGWLADRLDRFRACPCTCLLATNDLDAPARRIHCGSPSRGRRVVWRSSRATSSTIDWVCSNEAVSTQHRLTATGVAIHRTDNRFRVPEICTVSACLCRRYVKPRERPFGLGYLAIVTRCGLILLLVLVECDTDRPESGS